MIWRPHCSAHTMPCWKAHKILIQVSHAAQPGCWAARIAHLPHQGATFSRRCDALRRICCFQLHTSSWTLSHHIAHPQRSRCRARRRGRPCLQAAVIASYRSYAIHTYDNSARKYGKLAVRLPSDSPEELRVPNLLLRSRFSSQEVLEACPYPGRGWST